jgi:G3E family GTPase
MAAGLMILILSMRYAEPVPLLTICSMDPVRRDVVAAGLLCDLPGAVVVQHDVNPDPDAAWVLRRTVYDLTGVIEHEYRDLEHRCLSCALREDVLPVLRRLGAGRRVERRPGARPSAVVLALPVTAVALPVVRAVQSLGPGAEVTPGAVLATIDPATFEGDLFGDDLLADRGLELAADDRRAVGEALAHQVEYADVVVTIPDEDQAPETRSVPDVPGRVAALLTHLNPSQVPPQALHDVRPHDLVRVRRPLDDARGDLRHAAPAITGDGPCGVWTVDLHSWRPLHPDRLHEGIEALAGGRFRGRGHFWLPTRPRTLALWDGAGGQLSIGPAGDWAGARPRSRLVVTGSGPDADLLEQAFERALLTDAELARGLDWWAGREDGFSPWLDDHRDAA